MLAFIRGTSKEPPAQTIIAAIAIDLEALSIKGMEWCRQFFSRSFNQKEMSGDGS
jgi:hypothetical protein